MENVAVVIPTLNGGEALKKLLSSLKQQTLLIKRVLIVDSQSNDDTVEYTKSLGFEVLPIERKNFNHGGTRQQCFELLSESDIVVFLTQDVQIADSHALENLVHC
ncbi:MAG TPA: glycosyltransferase, partial [Bacillota bacterium]|nr:glycosyltransferase [Bacillota bacterium]